MLSIVTLPSPNDVISSVGSWSSPFFNEFSSFIGIAVGVVVVGLSRECLVAGVVVEDVVADAS